MKKTTYILIGTLAAGAVFAFLIPVLFFTVRKAEVIKLSKVGKDIVTECPAFASIKVAPTDYTAFKVEGYEYPLQLSVVEGDVEVPQITMDSSWIGNVKLTSAQGVLYVYVDMESALKSKGDGNADYVEVAKDNINVATVTVPREMLKQLEGGDMSMFLKDFVNADLHVVSAWNGFKTINSSFRNLDMK